MLHWIPYAFVRITACFIAGILSAIYLGEYIPASSAPVLLIFLLLLYFLCQQLLKRRFFSANKIIGVAGFATIFLLGYFNLIFSDQSLQTHHIIHKKDGFQYYVATVHSPGEERANSIRYEAEVGQYKKGEDWNPCTGKLYLYAGKEQAKLAYGDKLLIRGSPDLIAPPRNPGEFDYKRFLRFKNIYHQHYIRKGEFLVITNQKPNVILDYAFRTRNWASGILKNYIGAPREEAIAQALVLGVKDGLDNDIQNAYAASGAMHVLAVSGLHVGMIYGIVLLLLGSLQGNKTGRWFLAGISLFVLWSYAMITGFSPSVLRAVTMFSFVAVAKATDRDTNIYNTLAASAFFLLLYDPYLIMSVGFQLSFLAVFGIVYVQPKLYKIIIPNTTLMDKVWSITSVSIAAQLATFPLALFYFHQFPTYFLMANLLVIPAAFLILSLGLAVMATGFIEPVATLLGGILEWCIFGVNETLFAMEDLPQAQITGIHISVFETWLIIGMVILFLAFFQYRKLYFLRLTLFLALTYSAVRLVSLLQMEDKIIFYSINNHTAIDFIADGSSFLYADTALMHHKDKVGYHITPNHLESGITTSAWIDRDHAAFIQKVKGVELACWRGQRILILNDRVPSSLKLVHPFVVDYVVICKPFNKDLTWINKNVIFDKVIMDGSLSWYKANSLKRQLKALDLPYHSVYHDGAFKIICEKDGSRHDRGLKET